jgi:uncharacterized protein YndB with AHSA1/START domain
MTTSPPILKVTRHFDFPIERVFDAWLDPARASKFLFATPTGTMVRADIDARVGGSFCFTDRRDGEDVEHVGTYLVIDRPRLLVFTFGVPKYSNVMTKVSIEIKPLATGCELTLTHEGVLTEWLEKGREGWVKILEGMSSFLSREAAFGVLIEPGTVRFERLLPGPIERVWAYLTESDKRAQWLAAGEMEPRVGGSVELRFEHATLSSKQVSPPERYKDLLIHITKETVTAFEPPRILSLTWSSGTGEPSEVTFELTPQADKVVLIVTHRKLGSRAAEVGVCGGWHAHLAILIDKLHDREPDAFWSVFAETDGVYEKRFAGVSR